MIKEIKYLEPYGNCLIITNKIVELICALEFGPRILSYRFVNDKNIFFEDKENKIHRKLESGEEWKIYGGHRVWISPEEVDKTYHGDNYNVNLIEKEKSIILQSPIEEGKNIIKELEIRIVEESRVEVINRIINKGIWPINVSAWALTVLDKGGVEIIPINNSDTGLLPNRVISLWPYSNINDERVFWGRKYLTIKQNEEIKEPFKIGINNENRWAAYLKDNNLFIKTFPFIKGKEYPDYGVNYETYTNNLMIEMESLSEYRYLNKNEAIELREVWHLYKCEDIIDYSDNKIDAIINKFIPNIDIDN